MHDGFPTYKAAKRWLIQNFIPDRSETERRDAFFGLRQQPGEAFYRFQHRFDIAYAELDRPFPESYRAWLFKEFLLLDYRDQVDARPQFNKDEGYTVGDVVEYLVSINACGVPRPPAVQPPSSRPRKRRRRG
jgi:hypothetical protein